MKRVSVVLLCVVAATSVQLSPAGAEAGKDDEFELLSMINRDRAASGLAALQMDGRLLLRGRHPLQCDLLASRR